jgi:DNA modification methylase
LPLGQGVVLDPFMGGGSTVAAAFAVGYASIGVENDPEFFTMAKEAIPKLAALVPNGQPKEEPPCFPKSTASIQRTLFD